MRKKHKKLLCEFCRCSKNVLHLHHRTYKRLGKEYLGDVVLLCEYCHLKVHKIHKEGKNLWEATKALRKYQVKQKNKRKDDCPKCKNIMIRRKRRKITENLLKKPYYFTEWDFCENCKYVKHYQQYKVKKPVFQDFLT